MASHLLTLQGQIKITCPFILPSLVLQAFFMPNIWDKPWAVPIVTKTRDTFDLCTKGECLEGMPIQIDPNMASTFTDSVEPMEE